MAKKIPMRKCVACNEMKPKAELIRVVRVDENNYEIDRSGKKNGRGAYLCNSKECFAKAKKSRAFERSFSSKISEKVYLKLEEKLDE